MPRPKAYEPQQGYRYQILVRFGSNEAYEHCDYATHTKDLNHLLTNYAQAYTGSGAQFTTIQLPRKYWPALLKLDDGTLILLDEFIYTNTEAKDVDHIAPEDAEAVKNLLPYQSYKIYPFTIKRIQ